MTKRNKRHKNDFYTTPAWVVRRAIENIPCLQHGKTETWVDAGAGTGAIIRAAASACPTWRAYELTENDALSSLKNDTGLEIYIQYGDYLKASETGDVTLMNPPFSKAAEFIRHAKKLTVWVVALERIGYICPVDRQELLDDIGMPDVYTLPNRPSFYVGGSSETDMHEYAWFVWGPEVRPFGKVYRLPNTLIEERKAPPIVI